MDYGSIFLICFLWLENSSFKDSYSKFKCEFTNIFLISAPIGGDWTLFSGRLTANRQFPILDMLK
jgi:hypothetical protein